MSKFKVLDKCIGSAFLNEIDSFIEWAEVEGYKWAYSKSLTDKIIEKCGLYQYQGGEFRNIVAQSLYKSPKDHWSGRGLDSFMELAAYNKEYNIPFNVCYSDGEFSIIYAVGKKERFLIPTTRLEVTLSKDYTDYSISELKALRLNSTNVNSAADHQVSTDNLRRSDIDKLKEKQQKQLEEQKKLVEDIQNNRIGDLAKQEAEIKKMQQELYAKQRAMLAEANKMRFELEEKVEEMNTKIFYLETEINAIEGYFGESTTFVQLRSGDKCPSEEPVVLFQKVRFLDEELGRYFSMRNVEGTKGTMDTFEQALTVRDDLFELFAPSKKSISMIRISKTGIGYINGTMESKNILKEYDKFHGETLAILLRNGNNLWISWLDENKISFKDDLFYQSRITEKASETTIKEKKIDWTYTRDLEERYKEDKRQQKSIRNEFASRYVLFSVLQGILDNGSMMTLPEKVNVIQAIDQRNPYFIVSVADGWLEDTRLPTFSEMIDKYSFYNQTDGQTIFEAEYELNPKKFDNLKLLPHKENDDIYVLYHLSGWSPTTSKYSLYNTDNRSNTETGRDLAFSVELKDGIYKINLVKHGHFKKHLHSKTFVGINPTNGEEIYDYVYSRESECYIRGQKTWNKSDYRGGKAKRLTANFRLYSNEFINLTFLNSIFIDYVIATKRIGTYSSTYAHLVPMLNQISKFLKKREEKELECIKEVYPAFELNEWQIALSDWKLEKRVRKITPFQAKRFLKAMKFI